MRLLEILLIIVLLARASLTFSSYQKTKNLRAIVTFVASLVLLAQLYLEGWRWQLSPLYLVVFAALTVDLTRLPSKLEDLSGGASPRRALSGIGIIVVLGFLPFLLPVPGLPKPSGAYKVGSLSLDLVDRSRSELYSEIPADRRLRLRLWYPTSSRGKAAPWLEHSGEVLPALAQSQHLPQWTLGQLKYFKTHAYWNTPLASSSEPFPVVIFEHGLRGFSSQSSFLTEDLASQGLVVLAIEHPYGAIKTVFSDASSSAYHEGVLATKNSPGYASSAQRLGNQWAEDISFVLEQLASDTILPLSDWATRLELSQIAVVGHSTGAASSLNFCFGNERCALAVLLDPWLQAVLPEVLEQGIPQPVLSIFSDPALHYFSEQNQELYQGFLDKHEAEVKTFILNQSGHHNFDDSALISPLSRFLGHHKGSIAANRAFEIIRAYVGAGINTYLLGKTEALLAKKPSPFPEVLIPVSTEELEESKTPQEPLAKPETQSLPILQETEEAPTHEP